MTPQEAYQTVARVALDHQGWKAREYIPILQALDVLSTALNNAEQQTG